MKILLSAHSGPPGDADSEPYGLTITKSLQRGMPVVSSRSGGPSELLSNAWLNEVDDLDGCVRILWDNSPI
jgi:glycosyltransferase involved in cell wall biosynthesis